MHRFCSQLTYFLITLLMLFVLAAFPLTAQAQTTLHTYIGGGSFGSFPIGTLNFSGTGLNSNSRMRLTITLPATLPPDSTVSYQTNDPHDPYPKPVTWSSTDGVHSFNDSNFGLFTFGTDTRGKIIRWNFIVGQVYDPNNPNGINIFEGSSSAYGGYDWFALSHNDFSSAHPNGTPIAGAAGPSGGWNGPPWGARILLQLTGQPLPQPDYLVAVSPAGVTLASGVYIDSKNNVSTVAPIPYANVQSITILQDDPGITVKDKGPADRSLNRYIRPGQRSPELRHYTTATGWSYVDYTSDSNGVFSQHPGTSPKSSFTAYAIPRAQGEDTSVDVYNELTNASFAGKSSKLGLVLPRSIPRQILYAIGWHETKWQHFGQITCWAPTKKSHAAVVPDPEDDTRTIVTIDGGIGILQTTNDANLTSCPQPHPTFEQYLTHIYRMAADREYQIQVGAYHLANDKWPLENTDGEAPEFLEHWYHPVWNYNGAERYVYNTSTNNPGIWQIIQSADYRRTLPSPQKDDPGVQSVPLIRDQPQFADWNFDGKLDLKLAGVSMQQVVDSHNKPIGVTVAVALTSLNGFVKPTTVRVTLKPPTGNPIGPITLADAGMSNVFKGQALGTFAHGKYTLLIDITANGATKRAVFALVY